jgi:hypothetical protein
MRPSSPQLETLRIEDSHCTLKRLSGNEVFEIWIEPMGSYQSEKRKVIGQTTLVMCFDHFDLLQTARN